MLQSHKTGHTKAVSTCSRLSSYVRLGRPLLDLKECSEQIYPWDTNSKSEITVREANFVVYGFPTVVANSSRLGSGFKQYLQSEPKRVS